MIGLPHSIAPWPILVMQRSRLGSDKNQFLNHWFDSTKVRSCKVQIVRSPKAGDGCSTHSAIPFGSSKFKCGKLHTEMLNI